MKKRKTISSRFSSLTIFFLLVTSLRSRTSLDKQQYTIQEIDSISSKLTVAAKKRISTVPSLLCVTIVSRLFRRYHHLTFFPNDIKGDLLWINFFPHRCLIKAMICRFVCTIKMIHKHAPMSYSIIQSQIIIWSMDSRGIVRQKSVHIPPQRIKARNLPPNIESFHAEYIALRILIPDEKNWAIG